ncbi:MAG: SpoIID/LytB domain-containing protein [Flavobacteriales bacterium]
MRFIGLSVILMLFKLLPAQEVLMVLLYNDIKVNKAYFTFRDVGGMIEGEQLSFINSSPEDTFRLRIHQGKIELRNSDGILGNFTKLTIQCNNEDNLIRLQPLPVLRIYNDYPDKLIIDVVNGKLRFVNHVELEKYLTGVLKGEAGLDKEVELYKVHAVISRTYAIKNKAKHRSEGFNLCDQVHCQVYKGYWGHYEPIMQGVQSTIGEVLIDPQGSLIDALFHSNCGGRTVNSEDVWSGKLNYCRSQPDSFCFYMKNAEWEKEMSLNDFQIYLQKAHAVGLNQATENDTAYIYQSPERQTHWHLNGKRISFKQMRGDLELKSTFFDIYQAGNTIRLIGKGFGHGVGLCQEGAMCMAEYGFDYRQIIKHYYQGVQLKSLKPAAPSNDF